MSKPNEMKIYHARLITDHMTTSEEILKLLPELSRKVEKLLNEELKKNEINNVFVGVTSSAMSLQEFKDFCKVWVEKIK